MEKSEIKGFIAKRCAKELKNGDVVNLGIGLPTLIPNYLPKDVELIIHAELGIVSAGILILSYANRDGCFLFGLA